MNAIRMLGVVVLIGGVSGLIYGSFNYSHETQEATISSLLQPVMDGQSVNTPVWIGVGGIVLGSGFLFTGYKVKS